MDLSIPIIGAIAFLGYSLNDSKAPRNEEKIRKKISPHELPSGKNVYNSTFSKEIDEKERQIADIQFAKSRYPKETNIIPPLYNTECTWGCDKKISEYVVFEDQKILSGNQKPRTKITSNQITNGPMFNSSMQGFSISVDADKPYDMTEKFDNTVSQLSGLPLNLSHDNMVPFFGTNVTQNTDLSRGNHAILGNYTGLGQDVKIPRAETTQMFKPVKQEIHGTKTFGDLVDTSRYIPSIYQNNVVPVPQIRVQPLPEEYVRPAYKSVDNLRVANNPKNEYQKPLTSGSSFVSIRGVQSQFAKNRTEKYYENGSDRYLVTTGQNLAPRSRENFDTDRTGIKNVIAEVAPNVNSGYNPTKSEIQRYTKENCETSGDSIDTSNRKKEVKRDWVRNVKSEQYDPLDDFINRDSYFFPEQERETTTRMQLMPAKKDIPGAYAAIIDLPKTTMKDINLFSYTGNANSEVEKPMDYTSEYNRIKDRQYVDDNEYLAPAGMNTKGVVSTLQYDNIEISTARQDVVDRKGRMAGRNKGSVLAEIGDVLQRDDKPRNQDLNLFSNKSFYTSDGTNTGLFGINTVENSKTDLEYDFSLRNTDPKLVSALKTNPLSTEFGK
jgi:hypothetical protein